jgi:hypothetical protein
MGSSAPKSLVRLEASMKDLANEIDSAPVEMRAYYHNSTAFPTNTLARYYSTPLSAFNKPINNQAISRPTTSTTCPGRSSVSFRKHWVSQQMAAAAPWLLGFAQRSDSSISRNKTASTLPECVS